MALGLGYGLPFVAQHGANPYKTQWAAAREGAKGAGATVEDENAGAGSCLVSRGQDVYTDGLPFTPSLLIVPQFYKDGNLYQDVPPFVAEDSTMRFTVSRNTTATRVNSSGLIESVASGVPRIDWLGQSCPALLVEASGQNLALRSDDFSVSGTWGRASNTPVLANATGTTDPAGGTLSDLIFCEASGTLSQGLTQSITVSTSGTYTMSVFVKKASNFDWFRIQFTDSASVAHQAYYNIVSGTLGDVASGSTATITNFGNGWYRLTHSRSTASGTIAFGVRLANANSSVTVPCDGISGSYVWGAQVETGAIPTSYIPTTSGAVSRAADTISASGALVSGLIGQTEGTIYAEVDMISQTSIRTLITISDGTITNRIRLRLTSSTNLEMERTVSGSANASLNVTVPASGVYKIAFGYNASASGFVIYVNGSSAGTIAAATPTFTNQLTRIDIGSNVGSAPQLNNRIRAAAIYTTRLTNDQLANLTRLT